MKNRHRSRGLIEVNIGFLGVTIPHVTLSCSQYLYDKTSKDDPCIIQVSVVKLNKRLYMTLLEDSGSIPVHDTPKSLIQIVTIARTME